MKFLAILLILLSVIVDGDSRGNRRFCFPACRLPLSGRRYCKQLMELESSSCAENEEGPHMTTHLNGLKCGCQWEQALNEKSGKITKAKFFRSCKLLASILCAKYRKEITATTTPSLVQTKNQLDVLEKYLAHLTKLRQNILKLPEGREKEAARASIEPNITLTFGQINSLKARLTGPVDKTKTNIHLNKVRQGKGQTKTILGKEEARIVSEKAGWKYLSEEDKKKIKREEENSRNLKLLLSISTVCAVIVIIIVALLAKLRSDRKDSVIMDTVGDLDLTLGTQPDRRVTCWETFLEKLRNHYRSKEKTDGKEKIERKVTYHESNIPVSPYIERKVQKTNVHRYNSEKRNADEEKPILANDIPEEETDEEQTVFQASSFKNNALTGSLTNHMTNRTSDHKPDYESMSDSLVKSIIHRASKKVHDRVANQGIPFNSNSSENQMIQRGSEALENHVTHGKRDFEDHDTYNSRNSNSIEDHIIHHS